MTSVSGDGDSRLNTRRNHGQLGSHNGIRRARGRVASCVGTPSHSQCASEICVSALTGSCPSRPVGLVSTLAPLAGWDSPSQMHLIALVGAMGDGIDQFDHIAIPILFAEPPSFFFSRSAPYSMVLVQSFVEAFTDDRTSVAILLGPVDEPLRVDPRNSLGKEDGRIRGVATRCSVSPVISHQDAQLPSWSGGLNCICSATRIWASGDKSSPPPYAAQFVALIPRESG